jgi:hypothetical protein
MVDRIVPAATDESLAEIAAELGLPIPVPSVASLIFSGSLKTTLLPVVRNGKWQGCNWYKTFARGNR